MRCIEFDGVSKRYLLGHHNSLRETMSAVGGRLLGRQSTAQRKHLWSLRDVSFSVEEGEALGIVGRNGAGKSTVLKILAGITSPTAGRSSTRGRVAALLEVGTGFHPELTGRENIFLNGAILGMSRREITARFEQIVAFAGTERFLDTPVKRYSSGMHLRLAFAVAAHLEPDILVVDEVLAVGDVEFQRKCVGRMTEAESEGRSIIFVSHDLQALTSICARALWLESGQVHDIGPTRDIIRTYLASASPGSGTTAALRAGPVTVHGVRVLSADGAAVSTLVREDPFSVEVLLELDEEIPGLDIALYVTTRNGIRVFDETLSDSDPRRLPRGIYRARLPVPPVLTSGEYTVGLWIGAQDDVYIHEPTVALFALTGGKGDRPERLVSLGLPMSIEEASLSPRTHP